MRIHLERSGGFTGIPLNVMLDSDDLPADKAAALLELVEAADFFNLPAKLPDSGRGADQFQYVLTIEDGEREHTVTTSDTAAPPELQHLLQRITTLARFKKS